MYLGAKRLQSNFRAHVEYKFYQKKQQAAKLMQEWCRTRLVRMRFLHTVRRYLYFCSGRECFLAFLLLSLLSLSRV